MNKEQLKEAVGELNLVDTVFEADGVSYIDTAVSVTQVYDLIDQLDEPEKAVIPQFVADWYEQEGSRRKWWNWFYKWGGDQSDSRTVLEKRALEWMQDFNEGLFVDIFRYGYEIEKEKLYYAKIKGHELIDTEPILDDNTGKDVSEWNRNIYFIQQLNKKIVIDMKDSGLRGAKHFMTIKEWAELGINEDNAEFEPVEETP